MLSRLVQEAIANFKTKRTEAHIYLENGKIT